MGQPYVDYPGSAGRYASCASVNLLDADTAHCYQSVGGWTIRAQADTLTNETEATASVGGKVLQFLANAPAGQCSVLTETGGNGVAVGGSVAVSTVIRARTLGGVARTGRVVMDYYAAGVFKVATSGPDVALPADGSWVDVAVSGTTHADTDNVIAYLRVTDAVDNETFQIDRSCIRTGSVTSFVPSLRIVGDLDLRAKTNIVDGTNSDTILAVYGGASLNAWRWHITTETQFFLGTQDGTTATITAASDSDPAGGVHELRVTRVASTGVVAFYLDDVADGGATDDTGALAVVAHELEVGTRNSGVSNPFEGDLYWAEVRDGIDGPVVAMMNPQDAYDDYGGGAPGDSSSWTGSVGGRTWTANGAGVSLFNATPIAPDNLNAIKVLLASDLDTELLGYLVEAGATSVTDVTGALNELNSTTGIGFREAYYTFITAQGGTPAAG